MSSSKHRRVAVSNVQDVVAGERAERRGFDAVPIAQLLQLQPQSTRLTATTMRSCASLSQTSHGRRPGYFSGAPARSTSAPTPSAISPIADDRPPAPQSVIAVNNPVASRRTSISNFSMIGSPICTLAPATSPVVASIVALENVAPAKAVATGATTEHDHQVAGVRPGQRRGVVGDADAAAVHQRVGDVAGVVQHGAGDRRQADLVAVVGDTGDHTCLDQARVQHAVGELVGREDRWGRSTRCR